MPNKFEAGTSTDSCPWPYARSTEFVLIARQSLASLPSVGGFYTRRIYPGFDIAGGHRPPLQRPKLCYRSRFITNCEVIQMVKVLVVGYGVIGQRLADGVALQNDMELVGVVDAAPTLSVRALRDKGMPYKLFAAFDGAKTDMEKAGIPV